MTTRTPLVVGNWKLNTSLPEARALATAIAAIPIAGVETVLCPPFPWLVPLAELLGDAPIMLGAQDCWPEPRGAFTGDVSAAMLAPHCRWVIVGHSERRAIHREDDQLVASKVVAAFDAGLCPILCVGETEDERSSGHAERVIGRQVDSVLAGLTEERTRRLVIAYEPVWAIGSGQAATPADARSMAAMIRHQVATHAASAADSLRVLYGGSVNQGNAADIFAGDDVDGVLVGSASLDAVAFTAIRAAVAATS